MDLVALRKSLLAAAAGGIEKVAHPHLTFDPEHKGMIARIVSINSEIENELMRLIDADDSLKEYDMGMLNTGNGATGISRQMLMQWLLLTAKEKGIDETLTCFTNYQNIDHNPATEILAISGVEIEKDIEIFPGCFLRQFSNLPESGPKRSLDPELLRPENLLEQGHFHLLGSQRIYIAPQAALTTSVELRPRFVPKDGLARSQSKSTLLNDLCDSLTLIEKVAPLPMSHWFQLDEGIPGGGLAGSSWTSPIHDVVNHESSKLTNEIITNGLDIIKKYIDLQEDVRQRLRVAIHRLGKSRRHRNAVDKAIDLGVALESIYLGQNEKSEIAYTFRLRAAWHLGDDMKDRKRLIALFGCIYDMRSKAVHRGELKSEVKIPNEGKISVLTLIDRADALCADALKKIVKTGCFPNWSELVLGIEE